MSHHKPLPVTKDGWRYFWGEDDEPLCSEYIKELNLHEAHKRLNQLPIFVKRKIPLYRVKLSETDRAPQLKFVEEHNRVTGEKGYCMIRATHGCNRGKYYFETYIDSMPNGTAARIGWGQCFANLQAPLGYDHYGYSWRSRFGTKFHQARGKTFDQNGGYKQGDTIGCMIELPYGNDKDYTQACHIPTSIKVNGAVIIGKKKNATTAVIEEKDEPPPFNKMQPLVGSKISFYKNGRLVGIAYEDIYAGSYHPTISLYKVCTVTANFGPNFRFPPEKFNDNSKNHIGYQPMQDVVHACIIDNLLSDMIYILDQEVGPNGENKLKELIKKLFQN